MVAGPAFGILEALRLNLNVFWLWSRGNSWKYLGNLYPLRATGLWMSSTLWDIVEGLLTRHTSGIHEGHAKLSETLKRGCIRPPVKDTLTVLQRRPGRSFYLIYTLNP